MIADIHDHLSHAGWRLWSHTSSPEGERTSPVTSVKFVRSRDLGHPGTFSQSTSRRSHTSHHGEGLPGGPFGVLVLSLAQQGPLLGKCVLPILAGVSCVHPEPGPRGARLQLPGQQAREGAALPKVISRILRWRGSSSDALGWLWLVPPDG